jgi:predicted ATPase
MRPEAPPASGLVGRELELEAVHEALLTRPAPVAIVLEGEAGIGKTALLHAGVADAEARGMRLLSARPAEAETGLSYAALGDLLAPVVDEVTEDVRPPQRHALDVALLRASPDAGPVDAHAVGAAALAVLQAAARRAPLLLSIDDIQWLDPASAAAIRFALRRLGDDRVVLLATRRVGRAVERFEVGFTDDRLVRISVGALEPDALRRLLQNRLGEEAGARTTRGGIGWESLLRARTGAGGAPAGG